MTPEDVLARCCPVAGLPVFAIGVTESGVTVASQQRRAIHLVDALVHKDLLAAGSRLAIIGAGAAGLTAAARAARAGCRVTVFERDGELLATFRGSDRLLHPNLYRWPQPGWQVRDARLPLLSWTAGRAGEVARTIERQFKDELRSGLIDVRTRLTIGTPQPWPRRASSVGLAVEPMDGAEPRQFAVVILAVGFGRERRTGERCPGYWSNDGFSQAAGEAPRRYLIQGAGDGGLTDLLRLRLGQFDQDTLFRELLPDGEPRVENLRAAVQRIEDRAVAALESAVDRETVLEIDAGMDAAYRALDVAWFDERLAESGLRPNSVVLNDRYVAFGHRRFPLNKLLASRLVVNGGRFDVEWLQRDLGELEPPAVGPIEVDFRDGQSPRTFDRILFRLGPEASIRLFGEEIARGCGDMTRRGGDVARLACGASPPPVIGPHALATAVRDDASVVDLLQTLLLFLRHAGRPTLEIVEDPDFAELRSRAYAAVCAFSLVATDTAAEIAGAAAELLTTCGARPDIAARALAEALELRWRGRLFRSFRGRAGRRHRSEYGPNRVCPRQLSPHDLCDVGVGTVALMPPGRASLRVEWIATAWPAPLRIATGRVFDSLDDLTMHVLRDGEELVEFFGADARDAARHAARLDRVASRMSDRSLARSIDLVVLPEFALHADLAWASRISAGLDSVVFAGHGHVRVGEHKAHRCVVAFADSTVLLGKASASTYVRGGRRWLEDIHAEPPSLLAVGDGRTLVGLATEDVLGSPELRRCSRRRGRTSSWWPAPPDPLPAWCSTCPC